MHQKRRRRGLAVGTFSGMEGNVERDSNISAGSEHLVCLLDVLGFENRLNGEGLDAIYAKYRKLIDYVKSQRRGFDLLTTPEGHVIMGVGTYGNAFASDWLLFWMRYNEMAISEFTRSISEAICIGLEVGLPLRGAIAVGRAILDEEERVFLGQPLVECARTEKTQEWIGASYCRSLLLIHPSTVLPYKRQYKNLDGPYVTGIAVNWPRVWRESRTADLEPVVESLDTDSYFRPYYKRTLEFIAFSKQHPNWNPPLNEPLEFG